MTVYLYEKEIEFICFIAHHNPILAHLKKLQKIPFVGQVFKNEDLDIMADLAVRAEVALESHQILEIKEEEAWILHQLTVASLSSGKVGQKLAQALTGSDEDTSLIAVIRNIVRKLEQEFPRLSEEVEQQ